MENFIDRLINEVQETLISETHHDIEKIISSYPIEYQEYLKKNITLNRDIYGRSFIEMNYVKIENKIQPKKFKCIL